MTDPLLTAGPQKQLALFELLKNAGQGHSLENVAGAAINLIVNAIRQGAPTSKVADAEYSELVARGRALLANHYDSATGKRRNVFPHTQVIEMSRVLDPDAPHKITH